MRPSLLPSSTLLLTVGFRLLAVAAFVALTLPRMAQPGMFSDGVLYASVSRNLAQSEGSFWAPRYTATIYPRFVESPPLGLALEAIAFRGFGDHLAVERTYAGLLGLATLALIVVLWRTSGGDWRGDWLPLLFWIVPGITTWTVVNNMLENTQVVFTTAAVLAGILSVSGRRIPIASVAAGALIAAAVLTQGPVGLFPLGVPLLYVMFLDRGRLRVALGVTGLMVATLAAIAGGLMAYAPAREALVAYLQAHLHASLAVTREGAATGRGQFSEILFVDVLAGMVALLMVIWVLAPRPRARPTADARALFFIAVGLAGSGPMATSTKVMGHHFAAAIPMFAIGFGMLAWPFVATAFERPLRGRLLAALPAAAGVVLLAAAVAVPLIYGAIESRDQGLVRALWILGRSFPERPIMAICAAANDEWSLHAYVQRFYKGSLDASGTPRDLFLRVMDRECPVPTPCVRTRFAGGLELYSCQP